MYTCRGFASRIDHDANTAMLDMEERTLRRSHMAQKGFMDEDTIGKKICYQNKMPFAS
jgi:hypothetical protein